MTWSVRWEAPAEKNLASLDKPIRQRILTAVGKLADNPYPVGCRTVVTEGCLRLRVGDYRIKYVVDDGRVLVTVIEVVHRSKAY